MFRRKMNSRSHAIDISKKVCVSAPDPAVVRIQNRIFLTSIHILAQKRTQFCVVFFYNYNSVFYFKRKKKFQVIHLYYERHIFQQKEKIPISIIMHHVNAIKRRNKCLFSRDFL